MNDVGTSLRCFDHQVEFCTPIFSMVLIILSIVGVESPQPEDYICRQQIAHSIHGWSLLIVGGRTQFSLGLQLLQ
jgi:hypothetical protein